MSTVVYDYKRIDPANPGGEVKIPLITNIGVQVKLVVIDNNYNSDGGVVDSSATFISGNVPFSSEKSSQLRVILKEIMNQSEIFRNFWAKWSSVCGESGYSPDKYGEGITGPYFGLQIIQTFKGNSSFAGFAHTDYLFVPYFSNLSAAGGKFGGCNTKSCVDPNFDFWPVTSDVIEVKLLTFDTQIIKDRQILVAQQKLDFEQELKNYQAQLIAQSESLILSTYDYQPTNFLYVITRLLEFQQGTLITALDFAQNADLTQLYNLLGPTNGISYEIDSLAGLYPSINIEDGEGIPYGDGIPGIYEFFGWAYNGDDIFSVVNKDATSTSNYGIITRNGTEILDTRDFTGSLEGLEYFTPSDYITWGNGAGFQSGDIIECTITVTDYVDDTVNFVKSNYGFETDFVSSGLTITRGLNGGIYNTNVESGWDSDISPSGTTWNSEFTDPDYYGWSDLANVDSRTFGTFYNALNQNVGNLIVGRELVMYDETTDEYWAVKFTSWTQGQGGNSQGGGFEYERRLINQTGTVKTFKDTLVWKG